MSADDDLPFRRVKGQVDDRSTSPIAGCTDTKRKDEPELIKNLPIALTGDEVCRRLIPSAQNRTFFINSTQVST